MSSSSAPAPSSRHDAVQLERRDAHRGRVINRSAALQKRREEFAANARPVGAGTSTIYDWTTSLTASPIQLKAFDGAIEELHDAVSVGNHQVWGDPLPSHLQYRKRGEEPEADTADAHTIAKRGVGGPASPLPHGEVIQKAFGRHDLSDVKAHVGGHAQEASAALGAEAYATGSDIAFAGTPTLHTAAHEAAHIIQQRAGVSLKDGIGESGDRYERHADEVADAVVRGQSAEPILDRMGGARALRDASQSVQKTTPKPKPKQPKGKDVKEEVGGGSNEKPQHAGEIDAMRKDDLEKVIYPQKSEKQLLSPWERNNITSKKKRTDESRPAEDWKLSKVRWTKADVEYAIAKYDDKADGAVEPGDSPDVKLENGTANGWERSQTVGEKPDGTSSTEVRDARSQTVVGGGGKAITATSGTISVDGNTTQIDELEIAGEDDADQSKREKQPVVEKKAKSTLAEKKLHEWDEALAEYNFVEDIGAGFKLSFECKLLSAATSAVVNASTELGQTDDQAKVGATEAKLEAALEANAFDFKAKLEGSWDVPLLDELAAVALHVMVAGKAGVSLMADVKAGAGKVASQDKGARPEVGAMVGASGGAFAGAEISAAAGARFEWKKKPQQDYTRQLTKFFELLADVAMAMAGPAGLAARTIKELIIGNSIEQYLAEMVQKLYSWGPDGNVPLVLVEGALKGTAGAGIEGSLKAGFQAGKFEFKADGSITVGLGGGGAVTFTLDAVQLPIFAMVCAGSLFSYIEAYCLGKIAELLPESVRGLVEDDVAQAQVEAGYHKSLGVSERAALIDKMLDPRVANGSENAILDVLRTSRDSGDLYEVICAMEKSVVEMCSAIDGGNFHESLNSVLSGLKWVTVVGDVFYVDCDQVYMDDKGSGPYIYFWAEASANRSKASIEVPSVVEKSWAPQYKDSEDYGYYLAMPGFHDKVLDFRRLDKSQKGSQPLTARFKWISAAWGYRARDGIWPEK